MADQHAEFWREFAHVWSLKRPPYKPSQNEIDFWHTHLDSLAQVTPAFSALVLGCTPEFRELLAEYPSAKVTLADINEEMKKACDSLTRKKPADETFVKCDWRDMPFPDSTFDVVLGDCPHHNIKKNTYETFFSEVKRVLKPSGLFMLATWYFKDQPELTLTEYLNWYKRDPNYFSDFQNRTYPQCQLGKGSYYSKKTWEWDWGKIDADITRELNRVGYDDARIKNALLDWGNYVQVCPHEPEFRKFLETYFVVRARYQDPTHKAMEFKEAYLLFKN